MRHRALLLVLLAFPAYPHGGGMDNNGGHFNRTTGEYHCHRSGCVVPGAVNRNAAQQSKAAIKEAHHDGRPYSLIYDRRDWPHWIDADHDCQDTRAEILIATSKVPVTYRNEKRCSVVSGEWYDPYSGKTWTKASDLDLDHIAPIHWAHTHGAANWTKSQKRTFANDPRNLIPVEDNLNQAKGDKGPSEWMPPNQTYRCEYLVRFMAVVTEYQLQPTTAERRVLDRMGAACQN